MHIEMTSVELVTPVLDPTSVGATNVLDLC